MAEPGLNLLGDPVVHVLLSSYNGIEFLAAQMDSLLAQSYPYVRITIRDDGSSDGTPWLLQQYARCHENVSVELGSNLGAVQSFMHLLRQQDRAQGYFAFCDQDDIWQPDKIARAVAALNSSAHPESALYFSRLELMDRHGMPTQLSDVPVHLTFNNALVENVVTGATAVFGSRLRDFMLVGRPECMVWHDWWLYLVATAFGQIIYDATPTIRFRRHEHTQTNLRVPSREGIAQKVQTFMRVANRKRRVRPFGQAACFGEIYGAMLDPEKRALTTKIGKLCERRMGDRLRFMFDRDYVLNDRLDDLGLRLLVLLGRA